MTKKELQQLIAMGSKSIPRNPPLFGILHRMEIVESIGSGIKRMCRICREYGVGEPHFEVDENWFTITFPRPIKARAGVEPEAEAQTALSQDQDRLESRLEVEFGGQSSYIPTKQRTGPGSNAHAEKS